MPYNYGGTGYLSDAITTDTGRKVYLFISGGYSGSTTEIGYENFGTRVIADGATIESYSCAANEIRNFPLVDLGTTLFEAYKTRVQSLLGNTEARTCTINKLNYLNQ
tara:strand:- start:647 stop:967 length:321 start_codon:yes stop_codon:yes gene_type:complete